MEQQIARFPYESEHNEREREKQQQHKRQKMHEKKNAFTVNGKAESVKQIVRTEYDFFFVDYQRMNAIAVGHVCFIFFSSPFPLFNSIVV